ERLPKGAGGSRGRLPQVVTDRRLLIGRDRQDDIARLVPCLDVAVRLDRLVHRVTPVDHRPELARLDELLQEEDVLLDPSTDPTSDTLAADPPGHHEQGNRLDIKAPAVGGDVEPACLQRASTPTEGVL